MKFLVASQHIGSRRAVDDVGVRLRCTAPDARWKGIAGSRAAVLPFEESPASKKGELRYKFDKKEGELLGAGRH